MMGERNEFLTSPVCSGAESDMPRVVYHFSPIGNRTSIQQNGILASDRTSPGGDRVVFVTDTYKHQHGMDAYAIDADGIPLLPDDTTQSPDGESWFAIYGDINSGSFYRVEESDEQGTNLNRIQVPVRNEEKMEASANTAKDAAEAFDVDKIEQLKKPDYKSREKLISMSIDDFLRMAKPGRDDAKLADTRSVLEQGKKFSTLPFLNVDGEKVDGHEGRHRALALKEAGYETMPVVLRHSRIRWSEQSDPNRFDYVEDWPSRLIAEVGSDEIDFPVRRQDAAGPYQAGLVTAPEVVESAAGEFPSTIVVDGKQRSTTNASGQPLGRNEQEVRSFWDWFGDSPVVDDQGRPLVVYHGSKTPQGLTSFVPGGVDASQRSGDAYGVGAYFTSSPGEASSPVYTGEEGAVFPVYVRGDVLDLQNATQEQLDILTAFAKENLLPSDKARFESGRDRRVFDDVQEARDFFDAQRENYRAFGDGMARNEPDAQAEGGKYIVEFTNFDADVTIKTSEDIAALARSVGYDRLASMFDGIVMNRDGGQRWVVVYRPDENIRSSIGDQGVFGARRLESAFRRALPPTIEIDGQQRSTLNSKGQPIGRTEQDVRNFWRWFGDSKAVDPEGRPLVVYHGTGAEFDTFSLDEFGKTDGGWAGLGFYFTPDSHDASVYASYGGVKGQRSANVMPTFLSASNPAEWKIGTDAGREFQRIKTEKGEKGFRDWLKSEGFDSVHMTSRFGENQWVVLDPNQVKSAIGNRGTFDPLDANVLNQSAYHGTPHRITDQFSTERIGTGEGNQAYGWGLYFASKREVAEWYRNGLTHRKPESVKAELTRQGITDEMADAFAQYYVSVGRGGAGGVLPFDGFARVIDETGPSPFIEQYRTRLRTELPRLKDAIANITGQLYEVEIPEDSEMLMWDKPLREHPKNVQAALRLPNDPSWRLSENPGWGRLTGREFYNAVRERTALISQSDRAASEHLLATGIKGIKYLDGTSRAAGEGTYNYVIFSGDDVAIKNQFYQNTEAPRGSYSPSEVLMTLGASADRSTFVHESGHYFLDILADLASRPDAPADIVDDFNTFLRWAGVRVDGHDVHREAREGPQRFHQFAGIHARTADSHALVTAQDRVAKGEPVERVRRDTGWFEGVDGRWRFEIPDDEARFRDQPFVTEQEVALELEGRIKIEPDAKTPELFKATYGFGEEYRGAWGRTREAARANLVSVIVRSRNKRAFDLAKVADGQAFKLSDVLDHPKLYAAYPDLAYCEVKFVQDKKYLGTYHSKSDALTVSITSDPIQMLSTLLHEVQHAIQERESFARGGFVLDEFSEAVKESIGRMARSADESIQMWKANNAQALVDEMEASTKARYALMWQSAQRLFSYAQRDRPSGVRRLIINELQWIYSDEFRSNAEARELQRKLYGVPKPHRVMERNRYLADVAMEAARIIRSQIPKGVQESFKEDQRSVDRMVASLRRTADRKRAALRPLVGLQANNRIAQRLKAAYEFSGPYEVYRSLAGEVEARNTQARQAMTDEQRREVSPERTADVALDQVIVMFGSMQVHAPVAAFRRGSLYQAAVESEREGRDLSSPPKSPVGAAAIASVHDWLSMTLEQKRPYHEKWAEAFEGYLLRGQAPVKELVPLFERFSGWLKGIYLSLSDFMRGRKAQLSEDIVGVFDRLFSADVGDDKTKDDVRRDVEAQLGQAPGLPNVVKDSYGQLQASVFGSLAKRVGGTASSLWARYGLRIEVEGAGQVRREKQPASLAPLNQALLDILVREEVMPEVIEIDGVLRPTRNSLGKFIARTEDEIRNFWRWFGDSKLVNDQGLPLVVHHGTTQTKVVPGKVTKGDTKARQQLETMAAEARISDWSSVPSVFERLVESGRGAEFGVTAERSALARQLYERARCVAEKPATDIAFDVFNMPDSGKELGAHFGTKAQASAFGEVFDFYLSLRNPIRLPDLGAWDYQSVLREVRLRGVEITQAECDDVFGSMDSNAALRELLSSKGVDGVIYANEAEGQGSSYIAFSLSQIKSAIGNCGSFDPCDPGILRQSPLGSEVNTLVEESVACDEFRQRGR